jgi:hypothetical protein
MTKQTPRIIYIIFIYLLLPCLGIANSNRPDPITNMDMSPSEAFAEPSLEPARWPSRSAIQSSWSILGQTQRVGLSQGSGRAEITWQISAAPFDWDVLRELNDRAALVWGDIVANCAGGDLRRAIFAYRDDTLCAQGQSQVRELRRNIQEILRTVYRSPIQPDRANCRQVSAGGQAICTRLEEELRDIRHWSRTVRLRDIARHEISTMIERNIRKPRTHPLFQQILFEIASKHFFFGSLQSRCSDIFCLGGRYLIHERTPPDNFYSANLVAGLQGQRMRQITPEEMARVEAHWEIQSTSGIAIELLYFFNLHNGTRTCQDLGFGFWPNEANNLIEAMLRAGSYFNPSHRLVGLSALSANLCGTPPIQTNQFGETIYGPNEQHVLLLYRKAAAWRTLGWRE